MTASPDELVCQASTTSERYLRDAVDAIDLKLGSGYAKAHPELISTFMLTSSIDFSVAMLLKALDRMSAVGEIDENN